MKKTRKAEKQSVKPKTEKKKTKMGKKSKSLKDESNELYCYPACSLGRKYDQHMIQCCSCMQWIHHKCAHLDDTHNSVIWNCKKCRKTNITIDSLTSHVNEIKIQLTRLFDLNENLLGQLSQKTVDYETLLQENFQLKERLASYGEIVDSDEHNFFSGGKRKGQIHSNKKIVKNKLRSVMVPQNPRKQSLPVIAASNHCHDLPNQSLSQGMQGFPLLSQQRRPLVQRAHHPANQGLLPQQILQPNQQTCLQPQHPVFQTEQQPELPPTQYQPLLEPNYLQPHHQQASQAVVNQPYHQKCVHSRCYQPMAAHLGHDSTKYIYFVFPSK